MKTGQETANTESEAVKPGQEEIKPSKQQMKNYLKAKIKSLSWKWGLYWKRWCWEHEVTQDLKKKYDINKYNEVMSTSNFKIEQLNIFQ